LRKKDRRKGTHAKKMDSIRGANRREKSKTQTGRTENRGIELGGQGQGGELFVGPFLDGPGSTVQ